MTAADQAGLDIRRGVWQCKPCVAPAAQPNNDPRGASTPGGPATKGCASVTADSITPTPLVANRSVPDDVEQGDDPELEAQLDRIFGPVRRLPCPYCGQLRRTCFITGHHRCGCDHTWLTDVEEDPNRPLVDVLAETC